MHVRHYLLYKITPELETICVSLHSHYLFELKIVLNFKRFISVNIINYWFMTGTAFSLLAYGVKLNGYNKCQYSFIMIINVYCSSAESINIRIIKQVMKNIRRAFGISRIILLLVKFQR